MSNDQIATHIIKWLNKLRIYYNQNVIIDINNSTNLIYIYCLQQYKKEDIDYCFIQHLQCQHAGMFMPKVANLTKHLINSREEANEYKAIEAYEHVLKAANYNDYKLAPNSENFQALDRVVNLFGGWQTCRHRANPKSDDRYFRNEFIKYYLIALKNHSTYHLKKIENDKHEKKRLEEQKQSYQLLLDSCENN